jgi:RNA polymerase-binding transcription factor
MAPGIPRKPSKPAPAAKAAAAKRPEKPAAKRPEKPPSKVAAKKPAKAVKKPAAKAPAKAPPKQTGKTPGKQAPSKVAAKKPAAKVPAKRPAKQVEKTVKKPAAKTPAARVGKQAAKPPAVKPPKKPTTVICPLSGFEVKPDKPNLSPRTIERLRMKLVEERARHVQQAEELLAEAEALASEREGGDTQFDEESGEGDTVNIERERDLLLSASARQIVDEIDGALERIAAKTYGLCMPAGRRISLERLEALPYAETCVDCKARAERRR